MKNAYWSAWAELCVMGWIKGPKSNWIPFKKDIDRLKVMKAASGGGDQQFIFVYLTAPLDADSKTYEEQKLEQATGISLSMFTVIPANPSSVPADRNQRSYVYIYPC